MALISGQLEPGVVLTGYRIDETISRGGMGVVYRATDIALNRICALKVLAPELSDDDQFRERFKREIRIAASLSHPHVLEIHYAGEHDRHLFLVMDFVYGTELSKLLRKDGALEPARAVELLRQIASAVDAAHCNSLVHRDVKPANVLITIRDSQEHAYLTHFGLAKRSDTSGGMTRKGVVVGTVDYVSPEQVLGGLTDARSDIYALGCSFFHMLSGKVPYERESADATLFAHVHEPPPALSEPLADTYPGLGAVIEKAMTKDPADRYLSAGDLASAAAAALRGMGYKRTPTMVATGEARPIDAPDADGMASAQPESLSLAEPEVWPVIEAAWAAGGVAATASPEASSSPSPQASSMAPSEPAPIAPPEAASSAPPGAGTSAQAEPVTRDATADRRPAAGAPPAVPVPLPPASGPDGGQGPPPNHGKGSPSRRWLPAVGAVALLILAGVAVWLVARGGGTSPAAKAASHRTSAASRPPNAILQALAITNESDTAKHLIPPSSCKAQSATMVMCTHPAFGANEVTISTFPNLTALYTAYVAQAKALGQSPFRTNFGDCTEQQTYGEVSWNHRYEHPRDYSLAQAQSGHLSDNDAAGRVFCTFTNSQLNIVWTQNDGRVLGVLSGAPHANTWDWWKGVHHSIDIPGSSSSMGMSGSGNMSGTSGYGSSTNASR